MRTSVRRSKGSRSERGELSVRKEASRSLGVPPVDGATLRQVLRNVPTCVTLVTASTDAGALGMIVGSFVSISLEPPLVGFFAGTTSTTWPKIQEADQFCVNVLGADQEDVCASFSSPDRRSEVERALTDSAHPRFVDALAWMDCTVEAVHRIGDHDLCVGLVLRAEVPANVTTGRGPVIFYGGRYRQLSPTS